MPKKLQPKSLKPEPEPDFDSFIGPVLEFGDQEVNRKLGGWLQKTGGAMTDLDVIRLGDMKDVFPDLRRAFQSSWKEGKKELLTAVKNYPAEPPRGRHLFETVEGPGEDGPSELMGQTLENVANALGIRLKHLSVLGR